MEQKRIPVVIITKIENKEKGVWEGEKKQRIEYIWYVQSSDCLYAFIELASKIS